MKDQEYVDETMNVFKEMFGRHLTGKEQVIRWILWNCIDRGFQSGYDTARIADNFDPEEK